jgi:hypothetical protein
LGIDILRLAEYYYDMRIDKKKNDNLDKLLDGLSLLDEQDQERIIRVVDTLEHTEKKVKEEIMYDIPLSTVTTGSDILYNKKRGQGAICQA